MNERFGNSFMVHLVGPGVAIAFAFMAYQSAIGPIVHGGSVARIGLVAGCSIMAILILWLYFRTGLLRYEVSDAGLVIVRPWSRTVVPWSEIRHIDWKIAIHVIVLRGVSSVIAFSSTDLFPRMLDFLHQVRKRSQCTLAPASKRYWMTMPRQLACDASSCRMVRFVGRYLHLARMIFSLVI